MNDDKLNDVLKQTQAQAEEAVDKLGVFLRKGAGKLKEVAEKASEQIRKDLEGRP
ncbi:MAG TPA: hypothetical protein VGZ02_14570 [Candidatus Baltobacteraceae bacterium]|jgi:hypothetical protein|nr:hypothetical protein [Candidatus Baltobacteraceae bacterium]